MGLMQAAYETYCSNLHMAGVSAEGTVPLVPVSHSIQNAQIEIRISGDGRFLGADPVPKEECKTIIPVTEESAGRTSSPVAHPLCDQLKFIALGADSYPDHIQYRPVYESYLARLNDWAEFEYSHPKVRAVLAYCRGGTMIRDLTDAGVIACGEDGRLLKGKIAGIDYPKCLVRWRVLPSPEGVSSAVWEDPSLFESFAGFLQTRMTGGTRDFCYITGKYAARAENHPKGVVGKLFNAKLISANDSANFTYRGRFAGADEACAVSYEATQRAHSALRWVVANQGLSTGGRTFVCWNPKGKPVPPRPDCLTPLGDDAPEDSRSYTMPEYRNRLDRALAGYRDAFDDSDNIVLAGFDAATTGRLAVTYYNDLKASDFLDRLYAWQISCCWYDRRYGGLIHSPGIYEIVNFAFGTEQGGLVKADDHLMSAHSQSVLHCIADRQPLPLPFVRALAERAAMPSAYSPGNRERLLFTACALIRKYYNDQLKREEWSMELEKNNRDRSYLFGRLLAVAEKVEHSALPFGENRETNAIRMQPVFQRRPLYAWGLIENSLNPYYARLAPGLRNYYKSMVSEIVRQLPEISPEELGVKLDDTYLLGYYLQRRELNGGGKKAPAGPKTANTEYERSEEK